MQDDQPKKAGQYALVNKEHKEGSKVVLQAEIPHEELAPFRKRALDALRATLDIPGFRPGKASDEVVENHAGAYAVMERTAREALAEIYPKILIDENIDAVGEPRISITKLAPGNALVFTAETHIMPKIALADYASLSKKALGGLTAPSMEATEEEVEKSLKTLRERLAHSKWHMEHPEDEEHGHGEIPESEWPELTNELVAQIGPYQNVDELKEESRKAIKADKEQRERSRRRAAIADALVAGTPFQIPEIFIDGELGMMMGEFRQTIAHMGITLDQYLANINKSEEELRKEWRADAEKRARLQLILNRIADEEKLAPDEEKLHAEVAHLLEHHRGAKEENVRSYVESLMRNDLVFEFLEGK